MSANFDGIGRGPAAVNLHVLADGPTRLLQALQKCPDASLKFRIVCCCGQEHADAPYRLLRARRNRPRHRRATEQRDELAASDESCHLIPPAGRLRPNDSTVERCFAGRAFPSLSVSPIYARMLPRTLPAGFIQLCLPIKAPKPPSGALWLHEIKHDGFRVIARKDGARVKLYSRFAMT